MITENHKSSQNCNLLTDQQQKAIDLLLLGKTEKSVAEELEIARETVNRWRNHNPSFIAALSERQGLLVRWNNLFPWALDVIEQALAKPDPEVAIAVLQALAPHQLQTGEVASQLVLLAQARGCSGQEEENAPPNREDTTKVADFTNRRLQSVEAIANYSLSSQKSSREGA